MADLSYSASVTLTRNRARLISFYVERLRNADGTFTGQMQVNAVAQIGNWNAGVFTEHGTVSYSERMSTSAAAAFFGSAVLNGIQEKMLERMQSGGVLPAGTIS